MTVCNTAAKGAEGFMCGSMLTAVWCLLLNAEGSKHSSMSLSLLHETSMPCGVLSAHVHRRVARATSSSTSCSAV